MDASWAAAGITIRAVGAKDRAKIAEAFRALEQRTIYQRFFFPKKELSDDELRQLTQPEAASEVVLVAVTGSGNEERIVGLGRYARRAASAQIAFTVRENYQGCGIAGQLLGRLAQLARRNGIAQFEADVLPENAPMLSVLRHSGLPVAESEKDGVVRATLTLGDGVGAPPSDRRRVPGHALPGWCRALVAAFPAVSFTLPRRLSGAGADRRVPRPGRARPAWPDVAPLGRASATIVGPNGDHFLTTRDDCRPILVSSLSGRTPS
jgi:GNAT superfamily N-acetyltransferase